MSHGNLILFTPGPVRIPATVSEHLANPPVNYHRQPGFQTMFAETEAGVKRLLGIRDPAAYFATMITSTGTGANEACLLAMAGLGRGAVVSNGFFGRRAAAQASQAGLDWAVIELPEDRPIDPEQLAAALDRESNGRGRLRWLFYVSHETRVGLANPMVAIGRVCRERDLVVTADVISSAFAYPIDLEEAGVDLAVASSAKALMAAPGIGIIIARRAAIETLRPLAPRGYYLDVVAEHDKQSQERQPRFAQPVALHAGVWAAVRHLSAIGIERHMERIHRQLEAVRAHLETLDVAPMAEEAHRSGVVLNFRLPVQIRYPEFAARMAAEGYYLLYGIPGDESHFQVSTIGDLAEEHVLGLNEALARVLGG